VDVAERNKYNLGRYVPTDVREEVRRRCGFGCVICGAAWYDYEHFDPDFKDAKIHRAEGITLLCMQHNQRRARGTLSVESVRAANADPVCLRQGFSNETYDFGLDPIEVIFSSVRIFDCPVTIAINDYPVLSIKAPNVKGQPYLVSASFSDMDGQVTLKIVENVFFVGADNWDVECVGPRIIVKKSKQEVALILKSEPPNRIVVEKIEMEFEGVLIKGDEASLQIAPNGKDFATIEGGEFVSCRVGIGVSNR
jgi:hypothetical protein